MKPDERTLQEIEKELLKTKEELNLQRWGLEKTNEAIKTLYRELEKKNEELRALDKLKSDFVNTVSHELRTPLTTIREVIAQMSEGILGPTSEEQKKFLAVCLEDVDRLKRIIDNLLDLAKLESGKAEFTQEEVDVVDIATHVIASFRSAADAKKTELQGRYSAKKAVANADKDKITQVFVNLIGNALKFTENGRIEVMVNDGPDSIECAVSDTGRGIAAEDLPKVFGKFQQFGTADGPRENGTGLGLSIVKYIVELHQGKVRVESKTGRGTTFSFTIKKIPRG